jgi:hypothetical protein
MSDELNQLRAENRQLQAQVRVLQAVFKMFEQALCERGGDKVFPSMKVTPERQLLRTIASHDYSA